MKKLLIVMLATLVATIALASPASATTPRVGLTSSTFKADVGQAFVLKVRARHAAPHQKVVLQRRDGSKWDRIAVKYLPRTGRIKRTTFTQSVSVKGSVTYRVVLVAKGSYSAARSNPWTIQIVVKTPLRFNFSGARGLAMHQRSSAARVAPSGARVAETSTASTGSNLSTVSSSGGTSDAVVSGSADVSHYMIAPNGDVFMAFATAVDLSDTSAYVPFGAGCLLAKADAATGVPTCLDTSMWSLDWTRDSNAPVQFDASGAVYYSGQTSTSPDVLRKYANGTTTDLTNDNIYVNDFLVIPDGTVLISGYTPASGANWTRRISPSGAVQTLLNSGSAFAHMPDGADYVVSNNTVYKFQADATPQLQAGSWSSGPNPCWNLCYDINKRATTSDGQVFLSAGYNSQINKIYPTSQTIPLSTVQTITKVVAVGTQLVIAGRNSAGVNVLSRYNPATGEETALTTAANELETYHLDASDATTAMFDGLRFSDNRLVVGRIDVSTGQVTVLNTLTSKWEDFQTF